MTSKDAKAALQNMRPAISTLALKTDAFLQHTSRLLTTSTGLDNTLATILFTCTLLHSQLNRLAGAQQKRLVQTLASKAQSNTVPSEIAIPATLHPPATRLSILSASVKAMADTAEELWIALRLFGLFQIYIRAREIYAKPHRDPAVKVLLWAQVVAATCFQGLENAAFLAGKGVVPLPGGGGRQREGAVARSMAIANRFWMAQVVLEGLRLLRVRQLEWREELGAEKVDGGEGEKIGMQSEELKGRWKRLFYANAGWLPMTLHWSYVDENHSPVKEVWQGIAGLVPSVIGLQDAWRETDTP